MAKADAAKTGAADSIVSLKVTLKGTKPPVWRRLLVPGTMTLGALSEAILTGMGWMGGHLHAFEVGGRQYGDPATTDDVADENRLTLNGVLKSGVKRFGYDYDFGDNWEHIVAVEKTLLPFRDRPIRPASTASATARRKTAAASGATPNSWRSWPIPLTRSTKNGSSGLARTSTPKSSTPRSPTRDWPRAAKGQAGRADPRSIEPWRCAAGVPAQDDVMERRVHLFLTWIARNPLKSPESDEGIQENPSPFSWSGLDWLWSGLEEFGPRRDGVGRSLLARLSTRVDKSPLPGTE